ncbi:MAG: hypothetical protein ACI4MN_06175 [Candidatus Coproplasma sp.]
MKNVKRILATVLIAGSVLTVAGCSSGTTYTSNATSARWNVSTSAASEKNNIEFWRTHKEVASYSVDFTTGSNGSYKVEYYTADASTNYTTSFYMDKEDYDWSSASLPDSVKITPKDNEVATKDPVYVYETTLTLTGRYVLASDTSQTVEFTDSVTTICKFRLAGENLKPVYSKQVIKNTAPASLAATNKDSMCVTTDAVYETYYNRACSKAVVSVDDKTEADKDSTKTVTLEGLTFDNSQLALAFRAFDLSGNKTFNVCSPQNGSSQGVTATCSSAAELNATDNASIIEALENVTDENGDPVDDYIFFDGTPSDPEKPEKQIRFHNVSLGISADMKGSTAVYSYAAVENTDLNTTRAVLLKMNTPISFYMGTLSYTLSGLSLVSF